MGCSLMRRAVVIVLLALVMDQEVVGHGGVGRAIMDGHGIMEPPCGPGFYLNAYDACSACDGVSGFSDESGLRRCKACGPACGANRSVLVDCSPVSGPRRCGGLLPPALLQHLPVETVTLHVDSATDSQKLAIAVGVLVLLAIVIISTGVGRRDLVSPKLPGTPAPAPADPAAGSRAINGGNATNITDDLPPPMANETAHRWVPYEECTPEQRRLNERYMVGRKVWEKDMVWLLDAPPPPPKCMYAKAYYKGLHWGIVYHYNDSLVRETDVCVYACDVSNRGWPLLYKVAIAGYSFVEPFPVEMCTWVGEEEEMFHRDGAMEQMNGVQYDCQVMWQAQTSMWRQWTPKTWSAGNNCRQWTTAVLDMYHHILANPADPTPLPQEGSQGGSQLLMHADY